MSILSNTGIRAGASVVSGGYEIEKSLRFNSDEGAYLDWTPSSAGNLKTFTLSWWMKRCQIDTNQRIFAVALGASQFSLMFDALGRLYFYGNVSNPTGAFERTTEWSFRDFSAWYHVVLSIDTTQGTDSDRFKMYVNGEEITSFVYSSYPAQNTEMWWNRATNLKIGGTSSYKFDGYLAEVFHVDGQALSASDFGETNAATGQWLPKDCSGDLTYGTNGFYLKFDNISDLGEDSSGEDNDWTSNNFGATSYDGPWSADGSYTNSPTGPWSKAFDNDMGSYDKGVRTYSTSDSTFTFDVNNRPTWSNKIEIFFRKYSGTANVNGGSDFTTLITGTPASYWEGWLDISSIAGSSGTLSTIYISDVGSNYVSLQGIRLDGRMLLDGVASPSPISIDTPTTFDDEGNGTGNYATLNPLNPGASTLSNGNLEASGTGDLPTIIPGSGQWYYEIDGTGYDWDGTVDDFTDAAGVYNFGQRPFEETVTTGYLALNTYNLDTTKILSGTYEGNGDADGPVIWMNATPATLRISSTNDPPEAGDAVTFSLTTVDRLAGGFKIRNATTNNANGTTYYWSATSTRAFKHANAQSNE